MIHDDSRILKWIWRWVLRSIIRSDRVSLCVWLLWRSLLLQSIILVNLSSILWRLCPKFSLSLSYHLEALKLNFSNLCWFDIFLRVFSFFGISRGTLSAVLLILLPHRHVIIESSFLKILTICYGIGWLALKIVLVRSLGHLFGSILQASKMPCVGPAI